jgi:hypothetical protein
MKRSKHNLSNYKILSCDAGFAVPVGITEILPGDIVQHKIRGIVRSAPLQAPVMHQNDVRFHCFFVPNRIIWDDFEDFITGGQDGENASVPPTIEMTYTAGTPDTGNNQVGYLPDYLGVPPKVNGRSVSALPFRAYNRILNDYFLDQDLSSPRVISKASGVDTTTDVTLARVCWEKDYFTLARPEESKGPTLVLPLGESAPVTPLDQDITIRRQANAAPGGTRALIQESGQVQIRTLTSSGSGVGDNLRWVNPALEADLSAATGVDLVTLRQYFAQLRFQEARSKYGSKYVDYLAYYGVKSSDARLQRAEYLGGGRSTVQYSEVLQTNNPSSPDQTDAVGAMNGHGIAGAKAYRWRKFFEEHGFVICIMSIRPKTMYVDGIPRYWSRATKEDYYQRELEAVGQQEVLFKELQFGHATPDGVFGYSDRYEEYRRIENTIAGEMRDTLDYWHMARSFSGDLGPVNDAFVRCFPTDRVFAGSEDLIDQYYVMVHHSIQARRNVSRVARNYIF